MAKVTQCDECKKIFTPAVLDYTLPKRRVKWYVEDQEGNHLDVCPTCMGKFTREIASHEKGKKSNPKE